MKTALVKYVQRKVERRLGAPADHLRRMGEASFPGATARVFPTLKRGLGLAASCAALRLPVRLEAPGACVG